MLWLMVKAVAPEVVAVFGDWLAIRLALSLLPADLAQPAVCTISLAFGTLGARTYWPCIHHASVHRGTRVQLRVGDSSFVQASASAST